MDAFNTPGPYIPKDDIKNNLPAPAVCTFSFYPIDVCLTPRRQSREELQARQAALRSDAPGHGTQQGHIL